MPRFAITLNVGLQREPADIINHGYVRWCEEHEIEPVLLPTAVADPVAYLKAMRVEGILLSGGNDVLASRDDPGSFSAERNQLERTVTASALANRWPILGICRGMQFLNQYFGGTINTDVRRTVAGATEHVAATHPFELLPGPVRDALGVPGWSINSFHRQGVTMADLAPALRAVGVCAQDGVIEALMHPTSHVLAMQWHPERPGSTPALDRRFIEGFLAGSYWPEKPRVP